MNINSYLQSTVEMVTATPDPVNIVWNAAQHCMKQPKNIHEPQQSQANRLIRFLLNAGHHNPFEHIVYQFRVEGFSRSGLAQLTRHRIASYTVTSQHYQDYRDYPFVINQEGRMDMDLYTLYEEAFETALKVYDQLIRKGVQKEEARQVLPNAMGCGFVMTINARSLINFIRLRICRRNCYEIRFLAGQFLGHARAHFPELFELVHAPCLMDGKCPEGSMSCGMPFKEEDA